MKHLFAVALLLVVGNSLFAQFKHDYNFIRGTNSPRSDGMFDIDLINYSENGLSIESVQSEAGFFLSETTMSDAEGNLAFYSNGCRVMSWNHEMMENGDSINFGIYYQRSCKPFDSFGGDGYFSGFNASFALPHPNPDLENNYLFFHTEVVEDLATGFEVHDTLRWTHIDMNANNGLGKVVSKNNPLKGDTLSRGNITVVKHENTKDWWILSPKEQSNTYYRWLATADSIGGPWEQDIGTPEGTIDAGPASFIISPQGNYAVRFIPNNGDHHVQLFDFDRETGLLNNRRELLPRVRIAGVGSGVFSPSERFLYVNIIDSLYQYDMQATDLEASRTLIASWQRDEQDPRQLSYLHMWLGPDCRIYINVGSHSRSIHVINHPERRGLAAEYELSGLRFNYITQATQPTFPMYRLDTPYPLCDSSLVVSAAEPLFNRRVELQAHPNPAFDETLIQGRALANQQVRYQWQTMLGEVLEQGAVQWSVSGAQLFRLPPVAGQVLVLQLVDEQGEVFAVRVVKG